MDLRVQLARGERQNLPGRRRSKGVRQSSLQRNADAHSIFELLGLLRLRMNRCEPAVPRRRHRLIVAVSLDRIETGFSNGPFQGLNGLLLRRLRTGHVENPLLFQGAVEVINPVTKRELRQRQGQRDPITGYMLEVIQVDPAHGQSSQLVDSRGCPDM